MKKITCWVFVFFGLFQVVGAVDWSDFESNAVGGWNFTGNAIDFVGLHNGTVTDAVLTPDKDGNADSAYYFDGTADKINIGDGNLVTQSSNFSISMWVNSTSSSFSGDTFIALNTTSTQLIVVFGAEPSQQLIPGFRGSSGEKFTIDWTNNYQNKYRHVCIVWNGSSDDFKLFENGVENTVSAGHSHGGTGTTNDIGSANGVSSWEGDLDEVVIIGRALTKDECAYFYNNYDNYTLTEATTNLFSITAIDDSGNAINTFNASIDGIDYSTDTGTITTHLYVNSSFTYDLNVTADGFYTNSTVGLNISTNYQATLKLIRYFNVTARDLTRNNSISNFSVWVDGVEYSTVTGNLTTDIIINNGTGDIIDDVIIGADRYINRTYSNYNLSSQLNTYIYSLRVYVLGYNNTSISNFIVTMNGSAYDTTESILVPAEAGFNEFAISGEDIATTYLNETITVDYDALNGTDNITFLSVYSFNSILFYFYDEISDELINSDVLIELLSDSITYNTTFSNGSGYIDFIVPESYIVRYTPSGYERREYMIVITNASHNDVILYSLLNYSTITITVYDQLTLNSIPNAVVYIQRYYIQDNEYKTVAMYTTDESGKAYFNMQLSQEYYKFLVDYPFLIRKLETEKAYIQSTTINLYLSLTEQVDSEFYSENSIIYSLNYLNSSEEFQATYTDASLIATQFCLYLKKYQQYSKVIVNSTCSTSSSSTLLVGGLTENITYYGVLTATINGEERVLASSWVDIPSDKLELGQYGVFVAIILMLIFAFLAASHILSLILFSSSLIFIKYLGLISISWGYISTIVTLSIILALIIQMRR